MLVPDLTNPLFPPIVRGIQDRLEQAGYTPLIANTDNDPERERNDFEAMRARQVDGVITATARLDHGVLDEMAAAGLPIVLVNRRLEDGALPSATADDRDGARLAVEHLVGARPHPDRAPRRPAGRLDRARCATRASATAMAQAGLELDPALVRFGDAFTEPEGARLCEELLDAGARRHRDRRRQRPDGARLLRRVRRARRSRCPEDISVVGFNDMPFAERFNPPLTTIRIPHYEIGAAAGGAAARAAAGPGGAARPPHRARGPELVVRGSTARRLDNRVQPTIRLHTFAAIVCKRRRRRRRMGLQKHTLVVALRSPAHSRSWRRGCGGDDDGGRRRSGGGRRAAAKPLKIGASLPLTGDFSEPGKAAKQGYEVWEAMVNDKRRPARAARSSWSSRTTRPTRTPSSPTTTR